MHRRPASDDGTLSDRSRMRRVCCTPPGQPASGRIDPSAVAAVAVGATVAVAALAAATYHPARAERENHKLLSQSFISFLFGELHNAAYT